MRRMRERSIGARHQRGIAMLMAILLVALATVLAATIGYKSAMASRRGVATLAFDQSLLVAEAAEALAAYALREDLKAGSESDHPAEEWGHPLGPVEVVPGITLEAYLEDASGRFNLNSLISADGTVDENALHDLERLLVNLDMEPKWASLIADWIDRDSTPLNPDGAEDSTYAAQDPPYQTANTFITSPSELLALPDFGRERYLRLAPYVTALPRSAKLNVCTAPGVLIDALIGEGHSEFGRDPEQMAKDREAGCHPTMQDLQAAFGGDTDAWNKVQGRISQTSSHFRLISIVTIGSAEFTLYSLLRREATGQVSVLMRSFSQD